MAVFSLNSAPYNPDGQFSRSSLSRLEAARIPVMTHLTKVPKQLAAAVGLPVEGSCSSDVIIENWVGGTSVTCPPTWIEVTL